MIVSENTVPDFLFQRLQRDVMSMDLSWYYANQTTYGNFDHEETENTLYQHSYFHSVIVEGNHNSPVASLVEMCIAGIFDKAGIEFKGRIDRARFITQIVGPTSITHKPHIDTADVKYTGFMYINDSDGDSVMYNENYDIMSGMNSFEYYKLLDQKGFTVRETIEPRANKSVLFDSMIYHSSCSPSKTSRRVVLNFSAE